MCENEYMVFEKLRTINRIKITNNNTSHDHWSILIINNSFIGHNGVYTPSYHYNYINLLLTQ